jgi:hypothetical protein
MAVLKSRMMTECRPQGRYGLHYASPMPVLRGSATHYHLVLLVLRAGQQALDNALRSSRCYNLPYPA